jgi:hypothetical protein
MQELQRTQLQYISPGSFLKDQLLMNLPCFFIWLAGLWFVSFTHNGRNYHFIGWAYLTVIILFLITHGKNYYALGAYPVLFAFGAYHLEQFTSIKRKIVRFVFILVPVAIGIIFLPIALPILPPQQLANLYVMMHAEKTGALKWEDLKNHPLPQDFSDMLGWEEMAQKVTKAYIMLSDSEKQNAIIFCNNYGMAGAVSYYATKYHLPAAYSDNASFLYWLPSNINMQNFVLVSDDPDEKQHDFAKGFQSVIKVDSITNVYAREQGDYIYLFKGADENFRKFFREKIDKDKAAFK